MLTQLYQIGSKVKQGYFNSISNAREIPILESRSSVIEVAEPKTSVHVVILLTFIGHWLTPHYGENSGRVQTFCFISCTNTDY